ncbi:hypothetical protein BU15DRAFT_67806 [Melanogaster broomeanus]|nr:hypothetical protein BU15DRAFT_67806 [Melanogaster broomeanus]
MADPSLETRPNFTTKAYRLIWETLMHGADEMAQQVIECLIAAWEDDHNQRIEAWEQQRNIAPWTAEEAEQAQRELEIEALLLAEQEAEHERKEAEKKKPKMNDFDETTNPISSIIIPHPSQYAIQKLSTFDHVDLWYFSPAGCMEASKYHRSNADDAFGISKVDDVLTLCSVASIKASHNSVEDHELSFKAFLQAKNNFLFYAKKASWPPSTLMPLPNFSGTLKPIP